MWAQAHDEEERRQLLGLILDRPTFFRPGERFAESTLERFEAGIGSITAPVLVVVGDRDVSAAQVAAKRLVR